MAGYFVLGALAAFGLMCAVWTLWGLFLPPESGTLVYAGPEPMEFARRYLWLREMGLLRCPLTVSEAEGETLEWLRDHGIERTDRNGPV